MTRGKIMKTHKCELNDGILEILDLDGILHLSIPYNFSNRFAEDESRILRKIIYCPFCGFSNQPERLSEKTSKEDAIV
jgi:hypothetical protein